ncbi:tail fiber domain-containing protein [Balneola sp. MJW-20]|uniref:tail fiber domain-containing protein n=1 Tax=Gracilimonas aurantiaca TaxID=3234185 RepID=UPI003465833B
MKKLILTTILLLTTILFVDSLQAQVPGGFNFQAVARDTNGDLLTESQLGVQVRVLQGSESGTVVYTETHTPTTNQVGLLQIVIGEGTSEDDFSTIDWSADNYFVSLGIDPTGGTSYIDLGATRLLSVPYALLAQDVVNSGTGGNEPITEYTLNSTAGDTSFIVTATGATSFPAIKGSAETDGSNYGIYGQAVSDETNSNTMYGVTGVASGTGTGDQLGVFGSAVNADGTGGRRYGLYGQASSQGRENIGGFGIGLGAGDGDIVAIGDEFASGSFNIGGFNIGLVGFARGNLNGNIGIRGYTYGVEGARENRAVSAEAVTAATGRNIGVQALVHSSQSINIGYAAEMFDAGTGVSSEQNQGVNIDISNSASVANRGLSVNLSGASPNNSGAEINVSGGSQSNIGLIVNAATAAELNGNVFVNGDLNYSGALNNTSDRRLKKNIQPINNGLETIMKLNPTSYNFRGNGEYNGLKLATGLHYGLIAQEVEEVLPSLVRDNVHTYTESMDMGSGPDAEDKTAIEKTMEYKTMNYVELVPFLIKAVQEQQAEIERLRKKLEGLEK